MIPCTRLIIAIIPLLVLFPHHSNCGPVDDNAFNIMKQNNGFFTTTQGEVMIMNMTQKTSKGKVRKRNTLVAVMKTINGMYQRAILVKDDGTIFFSRQRISASNHSNESWLYIPPIPSVKNSGKIFKVNQNTLQQSFIGSDFDLVDLELTNIFSNEEYGLLKHEPLSISAISKRYGERILYFNKDLDISVIDYFKRGSLHTKSTLSRYNKHRAESIKMERMKRGKVYRSTIVNAVYHRYPSIPESVFNHSNIKRARRDLISLGKKLN